MLHFSLHINANTICDVRIKKMGVPENGVYCMYHWSVTEKETTRNRTVSGSCEHDKSHGAMELASQVLMLAKNAFHGKVDQDVNNGPAEQGR